MAHNAGECLRAYVDAVNSGSADKTFDLLKDATLKVPHGTTEQETMKGEQVSNFVESRDLSSRGREHRAYLSSSSGQDLARPPYQPAARQSPARR